MRTDSMCYAIAPCFNFADAGLTYLPHQALHAFLHLVDLCNLLQQTVAGEQLLLPQLQLLKLALCVL